MAGRTRTGNSRRRRRRRSVERERLENGGYIERRYNRDGQLLSEIPYNRDRQRDGTAYWYHSNGQKSKAIDFKDGKIDGLLQEFYRDGTIKQIIEYAMNVAKHYQLFDARGSLYDEGDYVGGRRQSSREGRSSSSRSSSSRGSSGSRSSSSGRGSAGSSSGSHSSDSRSSGTRSSPPADRSGGRTPPRTTARQRTQRRTSPLPSPLYSQRRDLPRQGDYENYETYKVDTQGRRQGWSRTYKDYKGPDEGRGGLVATSAFYYRDGMRNGPYWMTQERNGAQIKITGSYKDGKKDGNFKVVDRRTGRVIEQGVYADGNRIRHETYERDEATQTNTNTKYEHNKPVSREVFQHGELKRREAFDNQGRVVSSENYENGEFAGRTLHSYDEKGNRFSQTLDKDGNVIGAECYNEETKTLIRSSKVSEDGRPTEFEKLKDGKPDGKIQLSYGQDGTVSVKVYDADGKLREEYAEKNGQRIGDFKTYDENGDVVVQGTMDGKGNGSRTTWNKDGSQLTEEFRNGRLSSTSLLKDDVTHTRNFDENGALVYETRVDHNKNTMHSTYYEFGRKKSEGFNDFTNNTSEEKEYDVNGKVVTVTRSSGELNTPTYRFEQTEYYDYEAGKVRSRQTNTGVNGGTFERLTYNENGELYSRETSTGGKPIETQTFEVAEPTEIKTGWAELEQQQRAAEERRSEGENAPAGGGARSENGGNAPAGGARPENGGNAPAGGSRPENGENAPAGGGARPENGGNAPAAGGARSENGGNAPAGGARAAQQPTHRWRQKDGTVLEGRFTPDGKPDGTWVLKDAQGRVLQSEVYQGGKIRSFTQTDVESGVVVSGEFDENGKPTGTWTRKDSNGVLRQQIKYSSRADGGLSFEFTSSHLKVHGHYDAQGRPDGEWKQQYNIGRKMGAPISSNGSETNAPCWQVFTKAEFSHGEHRSAEMSLIDERGRTAARQNIRENWFDSRWDRRGDMLWLGWGYGVGFPKGQEADFNYALSYSDHMFEGRNPDHAVRWWREAHNGQGLAAGARPSAETEIRQSETQSQTPREQVRQEEQQRRQERERQERDRQDRERQERERQERDRQDRERQERERQERQAEELRRREEDLRRREEEQRRREEQLRREEEQRRREEELRRKEEELRRREEELRRREAEQQRGRDSSERQSRPSQGRRSGENTGSRGGQGGAPRPISREDVRMNEMRNNGNGSSGPTQVQQLMDMFKKRDEK